MPRFGKAFGYCFPIIVNNSNNKIMLDDLRLPKSLTKKVEKIVDGFRSPAIVEDENTHIYKFSAKVYTGNTYTQNPVGMCGEAYYCRVIKSDEPLEQDELEEILEQQQLQSAIRISWNGLTIARAFKPLNIIHNLLVLSRFTLV